MIASAETCSREETNQASASVGARDTSFWPSRNDWQAAYRSGAIPCGCRMQAMCMHAAGRKRVRSHETDAEQVTAPPGFTLRKPRSRPQRPARTRILGLCLLDLNASAEDDV